MRYLALMVLFFTLHQACAQSRLTGKVMEDHTDVLLSGIRVENQTTHINTFSDEHGKFVITAKKGDMICFSGLNYLPDTIYLISLKPQMVLLTLKQNQLNEVKVTTGQANAGYFNPVAEKGVLGSQTVFYKPGGGLKIKLFDSHKDAKRKKEQERLDEQNQQEQQISKVFSAQNLKNYLPISGQEMTNFIIKYTPSPAMFYDSKFDLTAYLNDSYKDFMKMPEDERRSPTYFQLNTLGN